MQRTAVLKRIVVSSLRFSSPRDSSTKFVISHPFSAQEPLSVSMTIPQDALRYSWVHIRLGHFMEHAPTLGSS